MLVRPCILLLNSELSEPMKTHMGYYLLNRQKTFENDTLNFQVLTRYSAQGNQKSEILRATKPTLCKAVNSNILRPYRLSSNIHRIST